MASISPPGPIEPHHSIRGGGLRLESVSDLWCQDPVGCSVTTVRRADPRASAVAVRPPVIQRGRGFRPRWPHRGLKRWHIVRMLSSTMALRVLWPLGRYQAIQLVEHLRIKWGLWLYSWVFMDMCSSWTVSLSGRDGVRFDIPLRESIDFDGEPPSSSRYESVLRQIRRARLACIVLFDLSRCVQLCLARLLCTPRVHRALWCFARRAVPSMSQIFCPFFPQFFIIWWWWRWGLLFN